MLEGYHRILLLFVDGVGLAPGGADNVFSWARAPALEKLLGGPLVAESGGVRDGVSLGAIDANLGVAGLPQSASGQVALFTGVNAARELGRHVPGFPGPRLRAVISRGTLFSRARGRGWRVTFANAYSASYLGQLAAGTARRSVTTVAVEAAGLRLRTVADLERSRAATWDVERDLFAAATGEPLRRVDAAAVGADLAALAARHRLTVYETFLPDLVAHRRVALEPREVVRRLDGLVGGLVAAAPAELTWLIVSDHGNFEDGSTTRHNRNPVPLLAVGPASRSFSGLRSIAGVAGRILAVLSEKAPS